MCMSQTLTIIAESVLATYAKTDNDPHYFKVYAGLIVLSMFVIFVRAVLYFTFTLKASSLLHKKMLASVIAAPLGWFHATPVGRILNRFGADQNQIDESLAITLYDVLQTAFISVGAIVMVAIAIPPLLTLIPFLIVYLFKIRKFVVSSIRELKRVESISRSPIYETVNNTINSLISIRAYNKQEHQQRNLLALLQSNAKAWYWGLLCNRYVGFRLDMLSVMLVFFTSIVAVVLVSLDVNMNAGLIGLSICYVLSLSGMLQFMVRQSALVETFMTSVERIIDYGNNLPKEDDEDKDEDKDEDEDEDEPDLDVKKTCDTILEFQDVHCRYREDFPTILKGVSFSVKRGDKVGIAGRTGAGKSTIVNLIFRLIDTQKGEILLNKRNLKTIPLNKLRSKITLIPQNPILFQGSVRFNLNPHDDGHGREGDLWEALEAVQLSDFVKSNGGLDFQIESGGSNLSHGQRQLFSLARAVIRKRPILVLDEPTSNVDKNADNLIRKMINSNAEESSKLFGDSCTKINIAHRITSIIDSDLIIVMDHGKVKESGSGSALIADKDSAFHQMYAKQKRDNADDDSG